MRYKSIILELLEQRPEIMEQLKSRRMLLPALEHYAQMLKARHETWKEQLTRTKPDSHEAQIASEALEIALDEMTQGRSPNGSHPNDSEPLSLDGAMAFLRSHMPRG